MQRFETTQELTLSLTPAQVMAKAELATQTMTKLQKFDEEYGLIKREKNKERKEMNIDIRHLVNDFTSKSTVKAVKCHKILDTESGDCWFEYEGGEYLRREMDEEEKVKASQVPLFDEDDEEVTPPEDDGVFNPSEVEENDVFSPADLAVVE